MSCSHTALHNFVLLESFVAFPRCYLVTDSQGRIVAITSLSYIVFGVTDYTNQISALESAASAGLITEAEKLASISETLGGVQPWQTRGLYLCITVLPCLFMLASYLLY